MEPTSKERLLAALNRQMPDRLPVTTHHVMPYFTDKYMNGIGPDEFFDFFGLDAIRWPVPVKADASKGEFLDPDQGPPQFLQVSRVLSQNWRIESEQIPDADYKTTRYTIVTPKGSLTTVLQGNTYTDWVTERLIKEKRDLEIVAAYQTTPVCDRDAVAEVAQDFGQRGIVRGFVVPFDVYGQPGCWQDFCCIRGTEQAIMDTYDDPRWVREFLGVLQRRKLIYIRSLKGSLYDLMELGGGDASTTVISPQIFHEFVAPYDAPLIEAAHAAGIRIAYHTCGGMMPILEDIAAMKPDAMETFTPPAMHGDADLAEAKRRIGDKVCMIGGFDQGHYFTNCSPDETRSQVRGCFDAAGAGGGYILSPSDHFFDADTALIKAYADEAKSCRYG
jgi:uroporphyrinogen decarboxylase